MAQNEGTKTTFFTNNKKQDSKLSSFSLKLLMSKYGKLKDWANLGWG